MIEQHVVVVPFDKLVGLGATARTVDFDFPADVHAIQWHNGKGSVEYTNKDPHMFGVHEYSTIVQPYVDLFHESVRKEAQDYEAMLASPEYRATVIREDRDYLLDDTQWVIDRHRDQVNAGMPTSLSEDQYKAWLLYRQELRDLTSNPAFPWPLTDASKKYWPKKPA